jgi:hypothetical protein
VKDLRPEGDAPTIATYGFNVPCRRFVLTSNVARDRRMPLTDEFVLRILKVAEKLSAAQLGAFFGFSAAEIVTVVADLQSRGLLIVSHDQVELTLAAHKLFRFDQPGVPQIVEVQTWVDRIWFDLVSRNMMTPERKSPQPNLLDVKSASAVKELPASFARDAFEQNFSGFLRVVRRINNPDAFSLYSVSEVVPDRFGFVVLSGSMNLVLDPEPRLVPKLLDVEPSNVARYRPLTEAMQDAVQRLSDADPSAAGLAEFRRLTGDTTVTAHHSAQQYFNMDAWLVDPAVRSKRDRVPIFGASYLNRNVAALLRATKRGAERTLKGQPPRTLNLIWYRPAGTAWGASVDLLNVVPEIVANLRTIFPAGWSLLSTLISPASARKEAKARFGRLFDRGLISPASHLAAGTEILILEGIAAMVLTRVALTSQISIPVGFVFSLEEDLRRVEGGLKSIDDEHDELWKRSILQEA